MSSYQTMEKQEVQMISQFFCYPKSAKETSSILGTVLQVAFAFESSSSAVLELNTPGTPPPPYTQKAK